MHSGSHTGHRVGRIIAVCLEKNRMQVIQHNAREVFVPQQWVRHTGSLLVWGCSGPPVAALRGCH